MRALKDVRENQLNRSQDGSKLVILVTLIIVILLGVMASVFMRAYTQTRDVADQAAISDADKFVNSVVQYRNFYTQLIVPRAGALGAVFTHDYLAISNALPIPATFIKDFGEFVSRDSETSLRLYSDMPFPWRGSDAGARDDFEREAMKQARENPTLPYWRIEVREGVRTLRYAKPDVLLDSCVACHNTYPGTPKTDWKEGDVRGVFELIRPLSDIENVISASFRESALLLGILGMFVLALVLFMLLRLKNALRSSYQRTQHAQEISQHLAEEMTAREHLHEALLREEQKLVAVFSAVADAIVVIDHKGIIQQINNAVTTIFDYQQEELIGQNISILMSEPHHTAHDGYLNRYMEKRQAHIIGYTRQLQAVRKDGSLVDIDLSVNEVNVGSEVLFAGVIRDVTQRIEAEQVLKLARDKAIENAKTKSQFLTNISHELRTPLNGIMGMSQLLAEDLRNHEDKEQARVIQSSAQQLLAIVDDILDFSSMESAKFVLNPSIFYVQSWLYDSLAIHQQSAQEKGLKLVVSIAKGVPERMVGDPIRLSQIINKLVSNAIKFTRDGRVDVRLEVADRLPNGVKLNILVKDTGIGISERALSRLFLAFSQLDGSATRAYGGTGLGLVISRQLALMMDGDVVVSSTPGQGSTFIVSVILPAVDDECLLDYERVLTEPVTIPDTATDSQIAPQNVSVVRSSSHDVFEVVTSMKILLIEDNVVNQKVAMALLKRMGYSVEIANNGQEGLERLAAEPFDAVLMDCQMPVMDGYEASRTIRQYEAGTDQHLPIIALTAHAMKGDAEKCYESGMDDYLTKPINHGLLKERLEYWQQWLSDRKKVS
jgi:PAS domain S-box-containing protein